MKQKIKNFFKTDYPISILQVLLTILFVVALLISNIISSRIFNFFGYSMTSAVIIFPITYILSDLFSEVYGYKWSRITCYLGFALNLFTVLTFMLVSVLPTFDWSIEAAESFKTVLTGAFSCTLASFIAYVIGDFANDKVFAKMKKSHEGLENHKGFAWRAILSSLVGEFFDSAIYLPLAFLVFNPIMSVQDVLIMILIQVVLKTGYEALVLPLTTFLTKKASHYEAKYRAKFIIKDEMESTNVYGDETQHEPEIMTIDTQVKEENKTKDRKTYMRNYMREYRSKNKNK